MEIKPHYYKKSTGIYEVIKETLTIYKAGGKRYILKEGDKLTIEPGVVDNVEGDEAWFLTYSELGWRLDDHIVVKSL